MNEEKITRSNELGYKKYIMKRFVCRLIACAAAAAAIVTASVFKLTDGYAARAVAAAAIDERITVLKESGERSPENVIELPEQDGIRPDTEEKPAAEEDGTADPSGAYPITYIDLSREPGYGEVIISNNETDYDIDADELRTMDYPSSLACPDAAEDDSPLVLIIHTHTTEAYVDDGGDGYCEKTEYRTSDPEKNVVAVGRVILDRLNERGIPALQCTSIHDDGDFYKSYERSEADVKEYLKKYPSIRHILDVHRDSVTRGDNEQVATLSSVDGKRAAQLMFVVGTDEFGADHPGWKQNLKVAVSLQLRLNSSYKNIARPISLRGASFNEQYSPGYLLLEVGSCANTLEEAKLSAAAFADIYADVITEHNN